MLIRSFNNSQKFFYVYAELMISKAIESLDEQLPCHKGVCMPWMRPSGNPRYVKGDLPTEQPKDCAMVSVVDSSMFIGTNIDLA